MEPTRSSVDGTWPARRRNAGRAARVLGIVAAIAAAAAACTPAGPDTTPPELTAPSPAPFEVGAQVLRGSAYEPGVSEFTQHIPARVTWSATDEGSGVCSYEVQRVYAGLEPETVFESTSETEFIDLETDYDDHFGGGSLKVQGWEVTAEDCSGNRSVVRVGGAPVVVQEDGTTAGYDAEAPEYEGNWSPAACTCWSNGAVQRTSEPGATTTWTNGDRSARVALVMRMGPDRGRFSVEIDGEQVDVVDTYNWSPFDRAVVWESELAPGAELRIVNEGTTGRARIDLDALIVRTT